MAPVNVAGPVNLVLATAALGLFIVAGTLFYNLLLHPLRSFPGPLLWRITPIPRAYWLLRGKLAYKIAGLHAQYGSIVRICPNEVAFSSPKAWNDIYGHRKGGAEEFVKWEGFYRLSGNDPQHILMSDHERHAALRRGLAHGFSERSMRGQEPIIGGYVELLIQKLHEHSQGGTKPLNMREWLNWTTFDVIGDLGFGSAFGCLRDTDYHPWVHIITNSFRRDAFFLALRILGLKPLVRYIMSIGGAKARKEHLELCQAKLRQRMELKAERPDFIQGLLNRKEELHLTEAELILNTSILITAGSETTATLLTGTVFLLTSNPDKLAKVAEEVRGAFKSEEEITLGSVSRLPYMLACLNEALRRYPPVPTGLPRVSPRGGAYVDGKFVPEGTVVAVWQWAINHNPKYWTDPHSFAPERFLGDERFKDDQTDAMQPFSTGPRNCIGKNLAYAEMRLILAKVIWNFDMTLEDDSKDWLKDQTVFVIWDKPSLNVRMVPVKK